MKQETQNLIVSPWGVYFHFRATGIGKIAWDHEMYLGLRYSGSQSIPVIWPSKSVERFDSPLEALDYYLSKSSGYDREGLIKSFLVSFPGEKDNLEMLLSQSQPKCTNLHLISYEPPAKDRFPPLMQRQPGYVGGREPKSPSLSTKKL